MIDSGRRAMKLFRAAQWLSTAAMFSLCVALALPPKAYSADAMGAASAMAADATHTLTQTVLGSVVVFLGAMVVLLQYLRERAGKYHRLETREMWEQHRRELRELQENKLASERELVSEIRLLRETIIKQQSRT